ncbi:MAG: ABC-F family ATP-binding cassette domain-containing protein [Anaerovoracaceae bacterium]|jgi:ATP-binding cassette subfamily F protein 3
MIILSGNHLSKEYGTDVILEDVSFHVDKGDRVGIVGANGAGKTTLMNILAGEEEASSGDFYLAADTTVGYLRQQDTFSEEGTVLGVVEEIFTELAAMEEKLLRLSEEAAAADDADEAAALLSRCERLREEFSRRGGYTYKSEMKGVLTSMAFPASTYNKPVSTLSGGERARLALACLLLRKPDLLLLDEPTNHLDIGTLKWLEQYLRGYRGTILVVSHDRYFLNEMVNRIFSVEHHRLYRYDGNYQSYAAQRKARREEELRHYQAQKKEIERQEEIIRRFKQRGTEKLARRAASREKKLARMERPQRPEQEAGRMKIRFREQFESGRDVIHAEDLAKGFGWGSHRRELFSGVNLDIRRGERICIVGPNGIGKTTLMKMLLGELRPDEGYLKIGYNVAFGYYDQEQQTLHDGNTVLEELKDAYSLYTDTEMRSILGRFLFRGEMVFQTVGSLSGGERARLALVKLMLSGANVLLLDEPTNHLDIESKEVFEDALLEFPGTTIVVSHDRYFLNKIPTRILELGPDGVTEYLGRYDYYQEKKQAIGSAGGYLGELGGRLQEAGEAAAGTPRQAGADGAAGGREGSGSAAGGSAGSGSAVDGSAGSGTAAGGSAGSGTAAGGTAGTAAGGAGKAGSDAGSDGGIDDTAAGTLRPAKGSSEERRQQKAREAEERRRRRRREAAEAKILETEARIEELKEEMCREEVQQDYVRLGSLNEELQQLEAALPQLYEQWTE